jgi:hypothetical protein
MSEACNSHKIFLSNQNLFHPSLDLLLRQAPADAIKPCFVEEIKAIGYLAYLSHLYFYSITAGRPIKAVFFVKY